MGKNFGPDESPRRMLPLVSGPARPGMCLRLGEIGGDSAFRIREADDSGALIVLEPNYEDGQSDGSVIDPAGAGGDRAVGVWLRPGDGGYALLNSANPLAAGASLMCDDDGVLVSGGSDAVLRKAFAGAPVPTLVEVIADQAAGGGGGAGGGFVRTPIDAANNFVTLPEDYRTYHAVLIEAPTDNNEHGTVYIDIQRLPSTGAREYSFEGGKTLTWDASSRRFARGQGRLFPDFGVLYRF